ncbi:hypothetical protein VTO42DRAFT_3657 [Malbranchea cinnamomea]
MSFAKRPDVLPLDEMYDGRSGISSHHRDPLSASPPSLESEMSQRSSSRIFNVYRTTSFTNWIVTLPDKTPLYYVRTSSFRPGRPEITLHKGGFPDGPIAGVSNFVNFSSNSKLGLGDPAEPLSMVWEDLVKVSMLVHSCYRLECTVYPNATSESQRKTFLWKRTHSVGVEDSKPSKLSDLNFKLVDEDAGELVAIFANNGIKSFKKQGKIEIRKEYGGNFETMVILSCMTLLERAHRRAAARSQWP